MKNIVEKLQEKRNLEVAKSILESAGYSVSKKSKRLKESGDYAVADSEQISGDFETQVLDNISEIYIRVKGKLREFDVYRVITIILSRYGRDVIESLISDMTSKEFSMIAQNPISSSHSREISLTVSDLFNARVGSGAAELVLKTFNSSYTKKISSEIRYIKSKPNRYGGADSVDSIISMYEEIASKLGGNITDVYHYTSGNTDWRIHSYFGSSAHQLLDSEDIEVDSPEYGSCTVNTKESEELGVFCELIVLGREDFKEYFIKPSR